MSTTQGTRRAHRGDPTPSHLAADAVNESATARLKVALEDLLREQSAAPFEVQQLYGLIRDVRGWPAVQPHSVNRRLSEMKRDGIIAGTGELIQSPDGRPAERLALTEAVTA